jgi:hypothetical protein
LASFTRARGAVGAADLVRSEIFSAVKGDQHVTAEPLRVPQAAAVLQRLECFMKDRKEALRSNRIEHGADGNVTRNPRHLEQCLTVRTAAPGTFLQSALMGLAISTR